MSHTISKESSPRYPSIATVSDDIKSHTEAINDISEAIQIFTRQSGDLRDSFVRVSDLDALGIANFDTGATAPPSHFMEQYARLVTVGRFTWPKNTANVTVKSKYTTLKSLIIFMPRDQYACAIMGSAKYPRVTTLTAANPIDGSQALGDVPPLTGAPVAGSFVVGTGDGTNTPNTTDAVFDYWLLNP